VCVLTKCQAVRPYARHFIEFPLGSVLKVLCVRSNFLLI